MLGKTIVIGFGHKAQRGKDTAVNAIMEKYGYRVPIVNRYSFATALRKEVGCALFDRWAQEGSGSYNNEAAMLLLCDWAGVPYDPAPPYPSDYPYGKQRALIQWWGTEYRRAQDPDYWVKLLVKEILEDSPDYALISDVRFPNEFNLCDVRILMERPGFSLPGASHSSETMLDNALWDHSITSTTSEGVVEQAPVLFERLLRLKERGCWR